MTEERKIKQLFRQLNSSRVYKFPPRGEDLIAPIEQGIYVIYDTKGLVVHVGRTQRGENGLRQRLNNHLRDQSSFAKSFLGKNGNRLRVGYKFRYLIIKDSRERALVEALAIGKLCPRHLGLGE